MYFYGYCEEEFGASRVKVISSSSLFICHVTRIVIYNLHSLCRVRRPPGNHQAYTVGKATPVINIFRIELWVCALANSVSFH